MVTVTSDVDRATIDIEKCLIENTWDVVVPEVVPSCLWMGDRTHRSTFGFNIQHNPPSDHEVDDSSSTIRLHSIFLYFITLAAIMYWILVTNAWYGSIYSIVVKKGKFWSFCRPYANFDAVMQIYITGYLCIRFTYDIEWDCIDALYLLCYEKLAGYEC